MFRARRLAFVLSAVSIVLGLALAAPAAPAWAHHGWGSYDAAKVLTLAGKVVEVKFVNPHVTIRLEVPGKTWEIVLAPPFRMQNRGLPQDGLRVGQEATVVGYPSRAHEGELRAERITVYGKTVELR